MESEEVPVDIKALEQLPTNEKADAPDELGKCGITCWDPTCKKTCTFTG